MRNRMRLVAGALVVAAGLLPGVASAQAPAAPAKAAAKEAGDGVVLVFRNGRQVEGSLLSESASKVKIRATVSGMTFETEYERSEILEIKRGVKVSPAAPAAEPAKSTGPSTGPSAGPIMASDPVDDGTGKTRVYRIDLAGPFGETITQTPIRSAVKDAKNLKADVIVLYLDAEYYDHNRLKAMADDKANFDEIFRAEHIVPIFAEEIPREWAKPPRVVIWVKQAMAGASLLPFICPELYFHSEGRMGGIGNLGTLFEGTGDEVVREKQRSLRLGHAEGWAISGGHDYRLLRAMARAEYVLSVRYVGGKPELFEGLPENPGEELLTDDGKDANKDTDEQLASAKGNDVLTFNATLAKSLGLAREIVDTESDLYVAMGIDRSAMNIAGRSKGIMKEWADGLDNAKRRLLNLMEDYQRVRVDPPGGYDQRTKARGRQTSILNNIKSTMRQWGESLTPRWLGQNGVPSIEVIDDMLNRIKIDQQKDKR